jgi:hypothetical protein
MLMEAAFVVFFLLLVTFSFLLGLGKFDDLLFWQMKRPFARLAFEHFPDTLSTSTNCGITSLPTLICVSKESFMFWNYYFRHSSMDASLFTVIVDQKDTLQRVCEDPDSVSKEEVIRSDIWMCNADPTLDMPVVLVRHSSMIVYPTNNDRKGDEMDLLMPLPVNRTSFSINLLIDSELLLIANEFWTEWTKKINNQLVLQHTSNWPCLLEKPTLDVHFTDIAYDAEYKGNAYYINSNHIRRRYQDKNVSQVLFYLPNKTPLFVIDETGVPHTGVRASHTLFLVLPMQPDDGALSPAFTWMMSQCMGTPIDLGVNFRYQSDESFPKFYAEVWFQRVVTSAFKEVMVSLAKHRNHMLNLHRTVEISRGVIRDYNNILNWIQTAKNCAMESSARCTLENLNRAKSVLEDWDRNPILMRPIDFPPDQYAAIFAPLLLPLTLPLIAGVVREVKRYRRLRDIKLQ